MHFLKIEKYGTFLTINLPISTAKFEQSCLLSAAVGRNTDAPSAATSPYLATQSNPLCLMLQKGERDVKTASANLQSYNVD